MFDNFTVLVVIIILLWMAGLGYYLVVSRRQKELSKDLEELRRMLDETGKEQENP
ncbi:MAG: hypothetical protein L0332_04170 [Chloroflexi bacterium]|nr:hypothetical protein [Chloroflexota bacterium]MCI0577010.1 hypothetical protein [Chloroflexota bacterium]MCI0643435.1 hypothetical protein [Chloroflexota bacterium]MCI0725906.1 hypothetical protein [Chloroflexota bacterium]